MRSRLSFSAAALVGTLAAGLVTPVAQAGITIDPNAVPGRTQVTLRYSNGTVVSTANSHESRPALSLVKLYLGYWVLQHGAPADKARVESMIRFSEDGTATDLDRRYPQAIPEIIGQFGLHETHYPGFWGNTTTSTEDLARFTSAIVGDPLATPIINGMRTASPVAADGYKQDFGTSRVPGVVGTKFGWDDNRNVHATASFGNGFSIAANTYGAASQLTGDILGAVRITADGIRNSGRQPSPLEQQILNFVPVQFHDPARQAIRGAEDSVTNAQLQFCALAAQAGSSHLCA